MVKKLNEELLSDLVDELIDKRLTGYQLFDLMKDRYPNVSKRLVYHYLSIALKRGYVKVEKVVEIGKFSWGATTEKKYYTRA